MANFPPRPPNAPTGSQFINSIIDMPAGEERDNLVVRQILSGNFPNFMRKMVPITITQDGNTLIYNVMPDFLAIGNDEDYMRFPITAPNAQKIADAFGCIIATATISDQIWKNATVKLTPQPLSGAISNIRGKTYTGSQFVNHPSKMVDTDSIEYHQNLINQQLKEKGAQPGQLVAGHMKDVVISNSLIGKNKLGLHGWHTTDGKAIQGGAESVHPANHIEYAMGVRLIDRDATLNNEQVDLLIDVLRNKEYAYLINGSEGVLAFRGYKYNNQQKLVGDPSINTELDTDKIILPSQSKYQPGVPPAGYAAPHFYRAPPAIENKAKAVLKLFMQNKYPIGTMIPFEADGKNWMARVEVHSNSPYGISVYEQKESSQPIENTQSTSGVAQILQRIQDYINGLNV